MSQTALVTGASSGLGREFAQLFARDGYDLVLVARREELLGSLARELEEAHGIQARCVSCDLSTREGLAKLARAISEESIEVDVLVNNAGFGDCAEFAQADIDKLDQMIELNIRALTDLTYYCLGGMLERRHGRILNVGSVASFECGPGMATYFASKAYVLSLGEALSEELRGTGVTVTTLCPGTTNTNFWNVAEAGTLSMLRDLAMANPHEVAAYGYQAMHQGRVIAIPGLANQAMIAAERFVPRALLRRIMRLVLMKSGN
jgi:short-subunit dehydrogenase